MKEDIRDRTCSRLGGDGREINAYKTLIGKPEGKGKNNIY
jgi:hypothetical protein